MNQEISYHWFVLPVPTLRHVSSIHSSHPYPGRSPPTRCFACRGSFFVWRPANGTDSDCRHGETVWHAFPLPHDRAPVPSIRAGRRSLFVTTLSRLSATASFGTCVYLCERDWGTPTRVALCESAPALPVGIAMPGLHLCPNTKGHLSVPPFSPGTASTTTEGESCYQSDSISVSVPSDPRAVSVSVMQSIVDSPRISRQTLLAGNDVCSGK